MSSNMLGSRRGGVKPGPDGSGGVGQRDGPAATGTPARRRPHKQPDCRDAGGAGRSHLVRAVRHDSADRDNRHVHRAHDLREPIGTEHRMAWWLTGTWPEGPRDKVIHRRSILDRFRHGVYRSANEEPLGHKASNSSCRN